MAYCRAAQQQSPPRSNPKATAGQPSVGAGLLFAAPRPKFAFMHQPIPYERTSGFGAVRGRLECRLLGHCSHVPAVSPSSAALWPAPYRYPPLRTAVTRNHARGRAGANSQASPADTAMCVDAPTAPCRRGGQRGCCRHRLEMVRCWMMRRFRGAAKAMVCGAGRHGAGQKSWTPINCRHFGPVAREHLDAPTLCSRLGWLARHQ